MHLAQVPVHRGAEPRETAQASHVLRPPGEAHRPQVKGGGWSHGGGTDPPVALPNSSDTYCSAERIGFTEEREKK